MAGDEMLTQEIEGTNLLTSSIDRNEEQEQKPAGRKMAGDEILTQETEGGNLTTSGIDSNEEQVQKPAESRRGKCACLKIRIEWMCLTCMLRALTAFTVALVVAALGPSKKLRREMFYEAVREGDLDGVKQLIKTDDTLLTERFTKFEENALQVAVVYGQEEIFSELLVAIDDSKNILEQKNMYGETILTLAAARGNIKIVKRLVKTFVELADIPNENGDLPITVAALFGNEEIVTFLFDRKSEINSSNPSCRDDKKKVVDYEHDERNYSFKLVNEAKDQAKPAYESGYQSFRLFKACISSKIYDIAYEVFELSPTLCIGEMVKENGKTIHPLARVFMEQPKGKGFVACFLQFCACCPGRWGKSRIPWPVKSWIVAGSARKLLRRICKQILESEDRYHIIQKVLSRPILIAVEQDNTSFTDTIRELHPDALWVMLDELSTSDMALSKDIFKIYISALKYPEAGFLRTIRADRNGNTILHHAALLSSTKKLSRFASPSLQMQSEIQWFRKVEKILPMYEGVENNDNLTPMDLFVQQHTELKKSGGKWLKETASSCSLVATLIITIMFSATFTVPGGYDNDTGIPINSGSKYFTIFIISDALSDALSLFSSCTSAMLFLRIYTSDFQDKDFLIKLPLTLTFGIFTLFLSIVTMVIAFSAAFFLTLRGTFAGMTLPVFMLASIPVIVYCTSYLWIFISVLRLTMHHLFN